METIGSQSRPLTRSMKSHEFASGEAIAAARVAVHAAHLAVSAAKKMVHPPLSLSLSQNENDLVQITRHLDALSMGASPSLQPPLTPSLTPSRSRSLTRSLTPSLPRSLTPRRRKTPLRRKKAVTRKKKRTPSRNGSFYMNDNNDLRQAIEGSYKK